MATGRIYHLEVRRSGETEWRPEAAVREWSTKKAAAKAATRAVAGWQARAVPGAHPRTRGA